MNRNDNCCFAENPLPPRSRLYSLPPVGMGTPVAESLTGYIARLADAHLLPTSVIVTEEIVRALGYESSRHSDLFSKTGASLNGVSATAQRVVEVVENLTQVTNLSLLTMLRWREVLSGRRLLRLRQAWCRFCLEEWRTSGKVLYEPLLWNVRPVTVCLHHRTLLEDVCPRCKKRHNALYWRSRPGHCPLCRSWLGDSAPEPKEQKMAADADDWLSFCTRATGDLIGSAASSRPLPEIFFANVRILWESVFNKNLSSFAEAVCQSRFTVRAWLFGRERPELTSLLWLCYRLGIAPVDMLSVPVASTACLEVKECPHDLLNDVRQRKRRQDKGRLEKALRACLTANQANPPSLAAVCKRLGCDQGQISREFPTVSKRISQRFQSHRNNQKEIRRQKILCAVQLAIASIRSRSEVPTFHSIAKLLPTPNWIREEWLKESLRALLPNDSNFIMP